MITLSCTQLQEQVTEKGGHNSCAQSGSMRRWKTSRTKIPHPLYVLVSFKIRILPWRTRSSHKTMKKERWMQLYAIDSGAESRYSKSLASHPELSENYIISQFRGRLYDCVLCVEPRVVKGGCGVVEIAPMIWRLARCGENDVARVDVGDTSITLRRVPTQRALPFPSLP